MSTIRSTVLWPYLKLARPANLITAIADVAAGLGIGLMLAVATNIWDGLAASLGDLLLLCIATVGLYGGGVVFNDIFDLEIDRVERPERPLPKGDIRVQQAVSWGLVLFGLGIMAAFLVNVTAGLLAIAIALLALLYDKFGKHHPVFGPVNMGLCRGGNLMLGISAFPENLSSVYLLTIIPILYISCITLISRGEVNGGNKTHLNLALVGYALVVAILLGLGVLYPYRALMALPFVVLFAALVFPPLLRAWKSLAAGDIRKAVKAGVISLIILDAALAAGFSSITYGLLIAALLPVSLRLGKFFSVT